MIHIWRYLNNDDIRLKLIENRYFDSIHTFNPSNPNESDDNHNSNHSHTNALGYHNIISIKSIHSHVDMIGNDNIMGIDEGSIGLKVSGDMKDIDDINHAINDVLNDKSNVSGYDECKSKYSKIESSMLNYDNNDDIWMDDEDGDYKYPKIESLDQILDREDLKNYIYEEFKLGNYQDALDISYGIFNEPPQIYNIDFKYEIDKNIDIEK